VTASIPACSLLASDLRELFLFHCDVYGNVLSVDYSAPIMECPSVLKRKSDSGVLHSAGKISLGRPGERSKRSPEEEIKKKEAAAPEEQSFFQKYWYIFLGIMLLTLFNQSAPAAAGNK